MPLSDKQSRSDCSGLPDQACTRCRERKIRCDRERPQCSNCERDEGVTCVYQNPPKRVNHLKLLCDSVDQLQDRLANIELHLTRLTSNERTGSSGPESVSGSRRNTLDDEYPDVRSPSAAGTNRSSEAPESCDAQSELHDRQYGHPSLVVLCNRLHQRAAQLAGQSAESTGAFVEMLQNVCETAATTEPFPAYSDEAPIQLPPKQQASAAIRRILQHTDWIHDLFVPEHLLANLERIYSQPLRPSDDAWATCFKAITLLVFGMEISTQDSNPTLFGDFARSLLPSRVALITSRLLTTPALINVQTLILLSVAAQQFDPPGWAELIFAHACMLARIMGLHQAPLLPTDASADETVERAKVLQLLYARDKNLCTTRGSVSWLPSHDCDIVPQLNAAVERRVPHSERLQLAAIQDEIYLLAQLSYGRRCYSSRKLQDALQSIERQLGEYARSFGIFQPRSFYAPHQVLIPLEFLATRILARRHSAAARHVDGVRADAKASCLLLLIAHDRDQDQKSALNEYHALTASLAQNCSPNRIEPTTNPFASVLDAFSVPAYFILLEDLLRAPDQESKAGTDAEDVTFDLLRRVSSCYSKLAARMQPNSYHCKVAWVFEQLLIAVSFLRKGQPPRGFSSTRSSPPDDVMMTTTTTASSSSGSRSPIAPGRALPPHHHHHPDSIDLSGESGRLPPGDVSTWPLYPTNSGLVWDSWLSVPSSLGPATPAGPMEQADVSTPSTDLLVQLLSDPHHLANHPELSTHFQALTPTSLTGRKRPRLSDPSESNGVVGSAPGASEAIPFHLIS